MFGEIAIIYVIMAMLIGGMFFALWMLPWSEKESLAVHESFVNVIRPEPIQLRSGRSRQKC